MPGVFFQRGKVELGTAVGLVMRAIGGTVVVDVEEEERLAGGVTNKTENL